MVPPTIRSPRALLALAMLIVALLATTVIVGPAGQAEAQAVVPFDCDGTPYIMQNSRMYQVVPDPANPGMFLFEEVGIAANYGNSLGFDPTTNLVYGVRKIGGVWTVLTYDATWSTVNQQPMVSVTAGKTFPTNGSNYAGTVLGDGRYIVATYNAAVEGSTTHNLWSIDAATGDATWIGPITPQNPSLADFAYNPLDGYMYHVTQGNLHQLNPLTGQKINLGAVPGTESGYGSSYFDAAGNLYVHKNSNGDLVKVSGIDTGIYTSQLVATTGRVSGADAASCVGELDLLKDVVDAAGDSVPLADRIYAPGDIVLYEFTIVNNALPSGPQALNLCDVLPADGRSYTGVATSSAAFTFDPPITAGDTSFCLDVTVPSSLWTDPVTPGGDPVTITVEVELGPDMVPGEYANQATLESPFDPGDFVYSDDPDDVSDPEDPTTINVTGEFTVTKGVATHPDGNDTDTFTIVVNCTDADGLAFDVTPDMVVDSAGDPWAGAGTNTFPIKDGESPRVIDLPAKATCSAVESPIPPAYSLTAASNDTTLPDGGEMVIDQSPGNEVVKLRNQTGEFSLSKFVFSPPSVAAPLDVNGSFPIRVECRFDGAVVLDAVFAVPVTDGVSGTLTYPDLPLLPHGANCSAAEQVPAGWDGSTDSVTFTIDLAAPAIAEFKNTRQVAPLEISKTIAGLPAGTVDTGFEFEVTVTCTGGFVAASETFGPFTIRTDAPHTLADVPVGSSCVVVETPTAEFSPVYSPAGGIATIAEPGSSVAIENVTGTLIIRKDTVAPTVPPTDSTGDFDFAMTCTDSGGISAFDGMVTVSVTDTTPATGATGGITYGDPQIPLLPPGTQCTISEIVPAGWTLTSAPSMTITIPADGVPPTAVFTNERPTADLTLTKTIAGLPSGVDPASFSFPVTIVCSHESLLGDYTVGPVALAPGTDITIEDLPVGASCVATEAPDDRFTPTLPADPTTIATGGSTLPITNTTQVLTITKTTTADDPTIDLSGTFPFTVVCDNGVTTNVSVTTDATGAGSATYPDLPLYADGTTCIVTETVPAGWTLTSDNDVAVELSTGGDPAPATGTPAAGALVSDNCQDGAGNAPFNLQIRNTTGNATDWQMVWTDRPYATIPNLSAGSYTHTVIDNGDGTYDHVFTGTAALPGYANVTITGGLPNPPGDNSCASVEHFIMGGDTGGSTGGGGVGGGEPTPGTAAFANTRNTGELLITKTIVGLPAAASPAGYSFTVDVSCTGDFVGGNRTISDVTLTTAGATIDDLPTGAVCVIAEDPADEFAASYPGGSTETITDADNVVSIVNTTSTFSIEKTTIVPAGVEQDDTFGFTWTCDNTASTSGTGTITTVNGQGSITFTDGLPLLPPGTTCSIDETTLPTGWTATASPLSVTTSASDVETASFENIRSTGELLITKAIVGLPSTVDQSTFDFEVTVTCTGDFDPAFAPIVNTFKAGETILIEDLPTGADCVVEESPDPQWTPLYDPVGGEVTIAEGQNDVAIVNSTGELIVFKENFVPSTQTIDPLEKFDFEITCAFGGVTVFGPQVVELDANAATPTGSVGGIAYEDLGTSFGPGTTCTVLELTPPAGWTIITTPNPIEVEVTSDGGATAQFENRRDVGPLTVTKQIDGLPLGVDPASFSFDIEVVCNHPDLPTDYQPVPVTGSLPLTITAGTPVQFGDLPTGAVCSVTESPATAAQFAPTLPADVTIDIDGETLAIVNTTRTLTIAKTTTTSSPLPIDLAGTFDFNVVCDNGYSTSVSVTTDSSGSGSVTYPSIGLLADGTSCTVTEVAPLPSGWTLDSLNDVVADLTGSNKTASFTNVRDLGQLTIDKDVVGLPAGQPNPTFTVNVICSGGFDDPAATPSDQYTFTDLTLPVTGTIISGLPTGATCEIAENPTNSYLPSYPDGTTTIIGSGSDTLTIVNETSTFDLLKTAVAPAGISTIETFTFNWSCDDAALSSGTATRVGPGPLTFPGGPPLVPVGTTCIIEEDPVPTGWTATTNPVTITTASGGPVTAEIVNTRDLGSLTITKGIEGLPGTPGALDTESFPITVTCTGDFVPSPAIYSETISVATSATITDLPVGATCSVIESPDPENRFFIVYAPGSTTIVSGDGNALGVINVTGELIVQKNTIVNTSPHPVSSIGDTFPVRVICSNGGSAYFDEVIDVTIDMESPTAAGAVGTGGIRYDDIPLLADGSTCTVAEVNIPAGWTETTNPAPGTLTIDSDAPVTAVLENTRDTGTLTVTKTIDGLPAGVDPSSFSFDITVACSGGGLAPGYTIPITVVPGTPYDIEQLPTGATCTATEDVADPRFSPTYPTAPTEITAAGSSLAIVNTTTSFSITKTASTTSALPIELVESFTFTVVCGAEPAITVTITTNNAGAGAADHTNGLPLVAPGTVCTVTEATRPGWTETSTIEPFTTVADTSPQLDFTNQRDVVELSIDKDFVGLPDSVDPASFSFSVDISCTGGFSVFADPYETTLPLTFGPAGSAVLSGIPTGATCSVIEQLPATSPFIASYAPGSGALLMDADGTIEVTNSTSTFAIAKTTVVPALADPDGTFSFSYTCNDAAASAGLATITTSAGSGSFGFDSDPANALPLLPPGTQCVVDETILPTGWTVTTSPITVTTDSMSVNEASFENIREESTLTISKTILGLSSTDPDAGSFTFDIEIRCQGDFPGGELIVTDTITTNNDVVLEGLPSGATCTITELLDPDAPFAAIYGPANDDGSAAEVTLSTAEVGAAITNLTGRVAWVKQTVVPADHNIDPVETFTFEVVCVRPSGVSITQTVSVTTSNETAAGAVGIPAETDFDLQPAGTICTITELGPPAGWTLAATSNTVAPLNPVVVEISPEPNPGVFINERDAADLTITKVIEGLPTSLDAAAQQFEVSVLCDHPDLRPPTNYPVGPLLITTAMAATVTNLPTGAVCTTTEAPVAAYATTYTDRTVTISNGETTVVTNSTGTLEVTKVASASDPTLVDLTGTFTFHVVCDGGIDTFVEITTDAAGMGSIGYPDIGLVPEGGTCTVEEQGPPPGWTVADQTISDIVTDGSATTAFANTRETAPLVVTKVIEGGPAGLLDDELFGLVISCSGDFASSPFSPTGAEVSVNAEYTLENLPTGARCTVAEVADPLNRFSVSYSPDPAEVTISPDSGAAVEITNATGELIVQKHTLIPAGREIDPTGSFDFEFDCVNPTTSATVFAGTRTVTVTMTNATPTGSSAGIRYSDLPLMPDGTVCTITEQADPLGIWTLSPGTNDQVVTISSDDPVTADFENSRNVATLHITKQLAGLPLKALGTYDDEPFTVTIACSGDFETGTYETSGTVSVNGSLAIDNLPTGAQCSITESDDPRFEPSYAPQTVSVSDVGAASTITNTTGELVLMKETVIGSDHPINAVETFSFEMVCTSPGATSPLPTLFFEVTPDVSTQSGAIGGIRYDDIPLLADGTICVVTETALPDDWTLTSANDVEIVIDANAPVTAPFINTHDVGDLTVTKQTLGLPPAIAASNLAFPISVVCNHPSLISDYQIDLELTGDDSQTIEALPANSVCVVEEAAQLEYATSYTPASGEVTILKDDTVTVAIVNETSYFSLRKTASADGDLAQLAHTFVFDVSCTNGFADQFTIATNAAGSGALDHADGLPLIPPGATCSIVEDPANLPAGWVHESPVSGEAAITGAIGDLGEVNFVNRRPVGPLTITKQVEGLPDFVDSDALTFAIDITCAGDFPGGTFSSLDQTVSVSAPLVVEGIPVDATCTIVEQTPVGFGFTPTYAPASSDGNASVVTIGGSSTSVSIVNSAGQVSWVKQTIVPDTHPIDPVATFSFDVSCTAPDGSVFADVIEVTTSARTESGAIGMPSAADFPPQPAGSICTIEELASGPEWALASSPNPLEITVEPGTEPALFINERQTGSLTVTNTVLGLPSNADPADYAFTFTLMCSGGGLPDNYMIGPFILLPGESITFEDLPVGSVCKVLQDPDNRFELELPDSIAITSADVAVLPVVNRTGTIAIDKIATAPQNNRRDLIETFTFTVSCSNGYSGTQEITTAADGTGSVGWPTLPLLATGTTCEVREQPLSGWFIASAPTVELAITTGQTSSATFLNESLPTPAPFRASTPSTPAAVESVPQPLLPEPVAETATQPTQPLALTGSSSRRLAAFAMLLMSLGFVSAGLGRRRRNETESNNS